MAPVLTKEEAQWILTQLNTISITGFNESQNLVAVGMKLQSIATPEEVEVPTED
jgi:hypothetical protein